MAVQIMGLHCEDDDHDRCRGGHTIPGVLGGWQCSCWCHRIPVAGRPGAAHPLRKPRDVPAASRQ